MIVHLQDKGVTVEVPDDFSDEELQGLSKEFDQYTPEQLEQGTPQEWADPEQTLQTWQPNFYEAWVKPAAQELGLVDIPLVQDRDPAIQSFVGAAAEELSFGAIKKEQVFQTEYEKHPIATIAGQFTGGLGSLMGTGAALGATKLPGLAWKAGGAATAAFKGASRFIPPAIMNAATFGTHTFINKTVEAMQEGEIDPVEFGGSVMKDTAFGAGIGAISGFQKAYAAVGSAYALGYISSKIEGGDEAENHLTAAVWGAFELIGGVGRDRKLMETAVKSLQDGMSEYMRQRRPSMSKEAADDLAAKIIERSARNVKKTSFKKERVVDSTTGKSTTVKVPTETSGLDAILNSKDDTLKLIEDINQQIRKAKINVVEPKPSAKGASETPEVAVPSPSQQPQDAAKGVDDALATPQAPAQAAAPGAQAAPAPKAEPLQLPAPAEAPQGPDQKRPDADVKKKPKAQEPAWKVGDPVIFLGKPGTITSFVKHKKDTKWEITYPNGKIIWTNNAGLEMENKPEATKEPQEEPAGQPSEPQASAGEAAGDVKEGLGETKIDPKLAKKQILEKLSEALKKAPKEASGVIEFSIPGDGSFKVSNKRSVIEELIKKVDAMPAGREPAPSKESTTSKAKFKITKDLIPTEDQGIITNGSFMAVKEKLPKTAKYDKSEKYGDVGIPKKFTDKILNTPKKHDAVLSQYEVGEIDDAYGVSQEPIATRFAKDAFPRAVFTYQTADGPQDLIVNQDLLMYFNERFEDLTFGVASNNTKGTIDLLTVDSKGKRVGVIMAVNREKGRIDDSPLGNLKREISDLEAAIHQKKVNVQGLKNMVDFAADKGFDPAGSKEAYEKANAELKEMESRLAAMKQQAQEPAASQAASKKVKKGDTILTRVNSEETMTLDQAIAEYEDGYAHLSKAGLAMYLETNFTWDMDADEEAVIDDLIADYVPSTKEAQPKKRKKGEKGFRQQEGEMGAINQPGQKASSGGAGSYTAADQKAALLKNLGGLEYVQKMQGPELVKLAKMLLGHAPSIQALARGTMGAMRYGGKGPIPTIILHPDIFKDAKLWEMVLAHEIGHLIDYLPDKSFARGNILGRLASLQNYTKQTLAEYPGAKEGILTEADRRRLRSEADKIAKGKKEMTREDEFDPQDVINIWNRIETEADKDLLEYIKKLSAEEKKAIIRAAFNALKKGEKISIPGVKKIGDIPAGASKIYEDLILQEIKKRRLYDNEVVTEELKALTKWWRPFNPVPGDAYTNYRYSGEELYADFISVMFNAPAKLKEMAPNAYKAFWNYLEKKPDVMKAVIELQAYIQSDDASLQNVRVDDLISMFGTGEAAFRWRQEIAEKSEKSIYQRLRMGLIDRNIQLLDMRDKVAKSKPIPPAHDPKYWIEQNSMIASFIKSHLSDLDRTAYIPMQKEKLTDLVNVYLFLDRIKSGDRGDIANPLGHTPETAKAIMDNLEKEDKAIHDRVVELGTAFRTWYQNLVGAEGGTDLFTPQQISMILSSDAYAPYRVTEYAQDYMSAEIEDQKGTFKDIGYPTTSLALKGVAVLNAMRRNTVKKEIGNWLVGEGFEAIPATITKGPGYKVDFGERPDARYGLIKWKEGGKWRAYWVDKDLAQLFNQNTETLGIYGKAIGTMMGNPIFRNTYITFNLSFQGVNFFRDFMRTWANLPNVSLMQMLKLYKQSFGAAARRASGQYDPTIQEMERIGALNITLNDVILGKTDEKQELDALFNKYDLGIKQGKRWSDVPILAQLVATLDAVRWAGDVIETVGKVAPYKALDNMSDQERAYWIRNMVGTPNYKRRGTLSPQVNEILLFSNIIKEGWRGFIEVGFTQEKAKNKQQYWKKRVLISILPKILQYMIGAGAFGTAAAVAYNKASEHLKTNTVLIPVGFDVDGEPAFISIPQDEDGRLIGALFWKIINAASNEQPIGRDIQDILAYGGDLLPSPAPGLEIASVMGQYASGKAPVDFSARDIMSEEAFKAGAEYSGPAMAKWLVNQTGLTRLDVFDERGFTLKSAIQSTPLINRFLRISSAGEMQAARQAQEKVMREESKARMDARKKVKEYISSTYGSAKEAKWSEIPTALNPKSMDELRMYRSATEYVQNKNMTSGTARAVAAAGSNKQKLAILESARDFYNDEAYQQLLVDLLKGKDISGEVYMKAIQPMSNNQAE